MVPRSKAETVKPIGNARIIKKTNKYLNDVGNRRPTPPMDTAATAKEAATR